MPSFTTSHFNIQSSRSKVSRCSSTFSSQFASTQPSHHSKGGQGLHPRRSIEAQHTLSFSITMGFINIYAGLSSLVIFSNISSPSLISSRMKWYLAWMCLVLAWNIGFFSSYTTFWVSLYRIGHLGSSSSSPRNLINQTKSLLLSIIAMHSASIVKSVTTLCNQNN